MDNRMSHKQRRILLLTAGLGIACSVIGIVAVRFSSHPSNWWIGIPVLVGSLTLLWTVVQDRRHVGQRGSRPAKGQLADALPLLNPLVIRVLAMLAIVVLILVPVVMLVLRNVFSIAGTYAIVITTALGLVVHVLLLYAIGVFRRDR